VSRRLDERRSAHQRYKQDVDERGKPFYPFAMFHDTVMSLVVVSVITALAVIWKVTANEEPDSSGWLGVLYGEEADAGTTNFIPRPDWYFYFLFYLLRIFKWPESVILGTIGIPTILLILLFALPFIDLRRERRLLRRPVAIVAAILVVLSMGVLTYKGATARESLGTEALAAVPEWIEKNNLPANARKGAELFAESSCLACHIYVGQGASNLGAPELTDVGSQNRGVDYFAEYVANPAQYGNTRMPPFASLGEENLRNIAIFLDASKGEE